MLSGAIGEFELAAAENATKILAVENGNEDDENQKGEKERREPRRLSQKKVGRRRLHVFEAFCLKLILFLFV